MASKNKKCCVSKCEDLTSQRHRFPKNDDYLFKKWLEIVNPTNWQELTDHQIYNRFFVCHTHFLKRYHLPGSKRGLTVDAIPTNGVPGMDSQKNIFESNMEVTSQAGDPSNQPSSSAELDSVSSQFSDQSVMGETSQLNIDYCSDGSDVDIKDPLFEAVLDVKQRMDTLDHGKSNLKELKNTKKTELNANKSDNKSRIKNVVTGPDIKRTFKKQGSIAPPNFDEREIIMSQLMNYATLLDNKQLDLLKSIAGAMSRHEYVECKEEKP